MGLRAPTGISHTMPKKFNSPLHEAIRAVPIRYFRLSLAPGERVETEYSMTERPKPKLEEHVEKNRPFREAEKGLKRAEDVRHSISHSSKRYDSRRNPTKLYVV